MPESCVRSTGVRTPRPADDRASSMEARSIGVVEFVRNVVVFDAADLSAESAFWAGMLGGQVFVDEAWHSVVDASGEWRIGVQLSPNHVPPDWPDGSPQQVHLDLHVDDPGAAHEEATSLGARLLKPAEDLDSDEGHQVYADPAGHPICVGWGLPSREALADFVADHFGRTGDGAAR